MSQISITGASTGSATFTIESPATSTNRTLTLPDNTGTIITQNSTPAFASTIGVGGATAAASGAGITFPATVSASSDANTLDDYEEGTWTPAVVGSTSAGTASYSVQNGKYTKIGNRVFVEARMDWSGGTGTGVLRISGLPFTSNSSAPNAPIATFVSDVALAANSYCVCVINPNEIVIRVNANAVGGGADTNVNYDAAGLMFISGCYQV